MSTLLCGGWARLDREVVSRGICTGCAGCVVACPYQRLEYVDFHPHPRQATVGDGCTARGCAVCVRACPQMPGAAADADRGAFGRLRLETEPWGIARSVSFARAADDRARATGQDGGVVTGLLVWGLATGRIDGVVSAARDGARPWEGEPLAAVDAETVIMAAGSRYTYCPTPLALNAAIARGRTRIALVGTSCQAALPAVMGAHGLNKWRRRVAWTFGLFCSRTFTYDGLLLDGVAGMLGVDAQSIHRMDVKGRSVIVEVNDGRTLELPVKVARQWSRPGCASCTDFAAERADISFGGIGQTDRWTLAVVRTPVGARLWEDARAEGVIVERPADEGALQALERMATAQRQRVAEVISPTPTTPGA